MRVLKLVIISFFVFFVILTIISLFIPSDVRISKAVQINRPKDSVMVQLAEPVNWRNWYPANDSLAIFHLDYTNGKAKGVMLDRSTSLIITGKKENEVMANYVTGSKYIKTGWKVVPAGNTAGVEWYMDFHLGWYPWKKFSSLLFEKRYGPVLEQGLNNLKNYLESDRSSNK